MGTFKLPWEQGAPHLDLLLIHEGDAWEVRPLESATGGVHCQAALFTDRDQDGDQDLLVTDGDNSSGHPTAFFRNDGGGQFVDDAADIGADGRLNGMGMASWDWNQDGSLDYCITDRTCSSSAPGLHRGST